MLIAVLLTAGLLFVVSTGRSQSKAPAAVGDANTPKATPAASVPQTDAKSATGVTMNSYCFACHGDFDEEELALNHEILGIGCERCHGESQRHQSDEDNITPPELMYPKERINPTCMMCHPRQDIEGRKDHQAVLDTPASIFEEETPSTDSNAKKYCTDCHAPKHHMNVRNIHWDKATGALLRKSK